MYVLPQFKKKPDTPNFGFGLGTETGNKFSFGFDGMCYSEFRFRPNLLGGFGAK